MASQTYLDALKRQAEIHIRKNADYAGNRGWAFNFEFSARIAEEFKDPVDKVFVVLITTKLARLAVLTGSESKPNNESIQDSFDDLAVYAGMWGAYNLDHTQAEQLSTQDNIDKTDNKWQFMLQSGYEYVHSHKEFRRAEIAPFVISRDEWEASSIDKLANRIGVKKIEHAFLHTHKG